MDESWVGDFRKFLNHLGACPEGYTLERVNVDGNYEPGNVIWTPPAAQARNKRNSRLLTYQGETFCLAEWAERLALDYGTLQSRLIRGWSLERAFNQSTNRV